MACRNGLGRAVWAAAGACLLLAACADRKPPPVSFVDDGARLLSQADEANVSAWHAALLAQYDIDYHVLTVDETDDLSRLAVRRFEDAQVGSRSRSGRGLLLMVDAGGEREATVGGGYERPAARAATDTRAQASPLETVAAYLAAMAAHDASPGLDLYAPATREMLAGHVVTRAQMDNLVRSYGDCPAARDPLRHP